MAARAAVSAAGVVRGLRLGAMAAAGTAPAAATAAATGGSGPSTAEVNHLVIYDGVCNLCDGTVKFLLARDAAGIFRFCALQSETAAPILAAHGISREAALRSITYIEDGVAYTKSAAALMIGRQLPQPYSSLASAGFCVPACARDAVYDLVASNRYTVFGRSEQCIRPSKAVMARFIDAHEHASERAKAAAAAGVAVGAAAGEATGAGTAAGESTGLRRRGGGETLASVGGGPLR